MNTELYYRFSLFFLGMIALAFMLAGIIYGFLPAMGVLVAIGAACAVYHRYVVVPANSQTLAWRMFGDRLYCMEVA